jgi:hypothetical protein
MTLFDLARNMRRVAGITQYCRYLFVIQDG